jgi:catechol 2,3-dioxygenase-like lactoylglutathione lyase family enzyme
MGVEPSGTPGREPVARGREAGEPVASGRTASEPVAGGRTASEPVAGGREAGEFAARLWRGGPGMIRAMGIPVTGVSELVLEVLDLEAAEAFYAGVLGFPVVERWPDRDAIWVMAGDRTRIGLWKPQVGLEKGRGGVHVHYAMHIARADYEQAVAELRAKGQEVTEHTFGPYEHSRAAYVMDPDGNLVEFWTWDVAGHLR